MARTREDFQRDREREAMANLAQVAHQGDGTRDSNELAGVVARMDALGRTAGEERDKPAHHPVFWGGLLIVIWLSLSYFVVSAIMAFAEFSPMTKVIAIASYLGVTGYAMYRLIKSDFQSA